MLYMSCLNHASSLIFDPRIGRICILYGDGPIGHGGDAARVRPLLDELSEVGAIVTEQLPDGRRFEVTVL